MQWTHLRTKYNIQTPGCIYRKHFLQGLEVHNCMQVEREAQAFECFLWVMTQILLWLRVRSNVEKWQEGTRISLTSPRSGLLLALPLVMLLSAVMSWWSFKAYPTNLFGDGDEDPALEVAILLSLSVAVCFTPCILAWAFWSFPNLTCLSRLCS